METAVVFSLHIIYLAIFIVRHLGYFQLFVLGAHICTHRFDHILGYFLRVDS